MKKILLILLLLGTVEPNLYASQYTTSGADTNANTICSGTTTYLDGEGTCDTLDGLEDFETATDAGVPIGNGTVFTTAALSGDVTMTNTGVVTVAANSVALATDTTGNYIATIADAGNANITVTGSGAENAAVTLNVVDVTCTDCLGVTEIADSYLLNSGDTSTGNLTLTDGITDSPQAIFTPQTGTSFNIYVEDTGDDLQIESNTAVTETIDFVNAGVGIVDVTIEGDLTITGDDLTMTTNTSGAALIADGTNFNPVVISGDVAIGATGTATIQADSVALTTDTTGNYVSSATVNEGLTLTGTEGASLGIQDCAANEIMKRNASDTAWICATDASGGTTNFDTIGDPTGAGAIAMAETAQTLDWNTAATAAAFDGLSISITNDATTDANAQRALVVENLNNAAVQTVERLLVLDNADGDAVTTALEIVGTSTGAVTTAIDASDAEIGTALAIGSNDITTGLTTISSAELDRLDGLAGTIVTDATATTDLEGTGLAITTGTLGFVSTEIGATTWGSGTGFNWTFDTGATDVIIEHGAAGLIFNTTALDYDISFAGDTVTNLLYLNAGQDCIGIGVTDCSAGARLDGVQSITGVSPAGNFLGLGIRPSISWTGSISGNVSALRGIINGTSSGSNTGIIRNLHLDFDGNNTGTFDTWRNIDSSFTPTGASTITSYTNLYINSVAGTATITTGRGIWIDNIDGTTAIAFQSDEGQIVHAPDARTIATTGDANPATLTLTPTSAYVELTCNDPDTCDITMGETNMQNGSRLTITNVTANVCDFADTAGVSELAGVFAMGQYDTLELIYVSDRWVELDRSNN